MVCSHCHQAGHTFRTCPTITSDEKEKKIQENKQKKIDSQQRAEARSIRLEQRRLDLVARQAEAERRRLEQERLFTQYEVINQNEYEVAIYWGYNNSNGLKHFMYIPSYEAKEIRIRKDIHRIVIFPIMEVLKPNTNIAEKNLLLDNLERLFIFNMKMDEWNESSILLSHPYKPKKTELDVWKEFGLKSNYLLQQLIKLGGKKYDNLEPVLDMVQDIQIPTHNDHDKELAGIPSALTNIT
jgi:hypothetical protein